MLTRKINRLWNGLASIRDHELDRAIDKGGIILCYNGKRMTLTAGELQIKKFQCHKKKFESMYYPDQKYVLYDFIFIDDNEKNGEKMKLTKEKRCNHSFFLA